MPDSPTPSAQFTPEDQASASSDSCGALVPSVALVNDYEVVVRGLESVLRPFADRVRVIELDSALPVQQQVDVALYDAFSVAGVDEGGVDSILDNPRVGHVLIYTWRLDDRTIASARERGVAGIVGKDQGAAALVDAVEAICRGEEVYPTEARGTVDGRDEGSWPGQEEGLSARQSEIIALIVAGHSNKEIVERTGLSINTVKSYIRHAYWHMGVTSRSQAVLWGVDHGFRVTPQPARKVVGQS